MRASRYTFSTHHADFASTTAAGLNPDGHRAHAIAQEACARADLAQRAWVALAKYTGCASWRPGHVETLLVLADLNLADLAEVADRVHLARSRGGVSADFTQYDARIVIDSGCRLDLADFATFKERKARVTEEAEHQRAAEQIKQKKAFDGIDPTRLHPARA